MTNLNKLNKLVEAAKNEAPLFSTEQIEGLIEANAATKIKDLKKLKLSIMAIIIIILSAVIFTISSSKKAIPETDHNTPAQTTAAVSKPDLKDEKEANYGDLSGVDSLSIIDTLKQANEPHENRTVYHIKPFEIVERPPFVYQEKPNASKPTTATITDYFAELSKADWNALKISFTNYVLKFYDYSARDTAKHSIEINKDLKYHKRLQQSSFSVPDEYRNIPLGISKTDGSSFINFQIGAFNEIDSLKNTFQLVAFKTPFSEDLVLWYKITPHLLAKLPENVKKEITDKHLNYSSTFEEGKAKPRTSPLVIKLPKGATSKTFTAVRRYQTEVDSSLITDEIAYKEQLALEPNEEQLAVLGITPQSKGFKLNVKTKKANISFEQAGTNSSLSGKTRKRLANKNGNPVYVSARLVNQETNTINPFFDFEQARPYQHFLTKRHSLLPVVLTEDLVDTTLVVWYEPTFELLEELGYTTVEQKEMMQNFVLNGTSDAYNKTSLVNLNFDAKTFKETIHNGIKVLELDDATLAKLGIFIENEQVVHTADKYKQVFTKNGLNVSYNYFTKDGDKTNKVEVSIPNISGGLTFEGDTVKAMPRYITDDLAQEWKVARFNIELNIDNKKRMKIIDSLMNVDLGENYLIPVLVKSGQTYTALDESLKKSRPDCIFWYKPSDLFLRELPRKMGAEIKTEIQALVSDSNELKDSTEINDGNEFLKIKSNCNYFETCLTESKAITEFSIYPNPVKELLLVSLESTGACDGTIQITDINGKTLAQSIVTIVIGKNGYSIPVTQLKEGVYLLVLTTTKGDYRTQRLIKVE